MDEHGLLVSEQERLLWVRDSSFVNLKPLKSFDQSFHQAPDSTTVTKRRTVWRDRSGTTLLWETRDAWRMKAAWLSPTTPLWSTIMSSCSKFDQEAVRHLCFWSSVIVIIFIYHYESWQKTKWVKISQNNERTNERTLYLSHLWKRKNRMKRCKWRI